MGITSNNKAFNLIEIVVVAALVIMLIGIASASISISKKKTRDMQRKADISQIGRFFVLDCYLPESGGGEYDLSQITAELLEKKPDYAKYITDKIKDPLAASNNNSLYRYKVTDDGKHCVSYTNLENKSENVTLPDISMPTMGGGTGVFEASTPGWNKSKKYYQISK